MPETTEGEKKCATRPDPPNRVSTVAAFTDQPAALEAPSGLTASPSAWGPNAVQLDWAEVPGAAGYIVYLSYADPATEIAEQPYLELSPDPVPLQPGDLILLSRKILSLRPEDISPRVWGAKEWQGITPAIVSNKSNDPAVGTTWEWLRFDAADPAPEPHLGPWFLRRTLAPGARIEDGRYFAAGLTQSNYEILRPGRTYRWRARLRASAPVEATLSIPEPIKGTRFALSTEWQDCVFDFSVPEMSMDDRPIKWTLAVMAGGAPLAVDYADVELFDTSLPLNVEESANRTGHLRARPHPDEGRRDHLGCRHGDELQRPGRTRTRRCTRCARSAITSARAPGSSSTGTCRARTGSTSWPISLPRSQAGIRWR